MPEPETPLSERPWEDVEQMVDVDQAREIVLAAFTPLHVVDLPIRDALGFVIARDVIAAEPIPPFINSAMDGYAVRAADTQDASHNSPIRLHVVGNLAAGSVTDRLVAPGTAIRIMTGAALPSGADAVVRFEETDEPAHRPVKAGKLPTHVCIHHPAKQMDNVRPAGEDIAIGTTVVAKGTRLRPAEIGILASLNQELVSVHRRPRVGILSTGNEVVDLGPALQPGQIRNSNSYTLAAMATKYGGEPVLLGVTRDTVDEISQGLSKDLKLDMIVTSGGVSLGDYDMVKDVLRAQGEIAIWQVRMKPGKPLAFGHLGQTPLLGLPGNPVAAAVSFVQFGRSAIFKMLGRRDLDIPIVEATLTERIDNRGHRRHYVRARVEGDFAKGHTVRTAGEQGAGVLSSLARANGLLIIPEELEVAEPGMRLQVQMIDWDLG
jgi:molybdopterin molybdotransferase